jgi:hypothetical protein
VNEEKATSLVVHGAGMTSEEEAALAKDDSMTEIRLMHGINPNVMQNDPVGIRAGDFLIRSGKRRIPCGKEGNGFRSYVGPARPRAIQREIEAPFKVLRESFDVRSKDFLEIQGRAANWKTGKGYKVGFDFLLWLPDWDTCATIYLSGKDRTDLAPILMQCRKDLKLAQFSTTISGDNRVNLQVTAIHSRDPIPMPSADRWKRVIEQFESYKLEVPIEDPSQAPQR